jgi:2-hydroxymuconate-semialdehyde hydrolase
MDWSRIALWTAVAGILTWTLLGLWPKPEPTADLPVPGTFIRFEKERIYFQERGSGPVLLFLHGFPYHSESFGPIWTREWPGHRLLRLDLPGLGLSALPAGEQATPDELALAVKLCLDQMGIRRVQVVGHDLGGGVALVLAARYPTLVTQLALICPDTSVGGADAGESWWWRLPGVAEVAASVLPVRPWLRSALAEAWGRPDTDWEQLVEQYAQPLSTWDGRRNALRVRRGRRGSDYARFEERLRTPTLVLWGDRDRVSDPVRGRKWAEGLTPPARFMRLSGVGHLPCEEAPDQVYAALQGFFIGERPVRFEPVTERPVPEPTPKPAAPARPLRRPVASPRPGSTVPPPAPTPAPAAKAPVPGVQPADLSAPTAEPAAPTVVPAAPAAEPAAPTAVPGSAPAPAESPVGTPQPLPAP